MNTVMYDAQLMMQVMLKIRSKIQGLKRIYPNALITIAFLTGLVSDSLHVTLLAVATGNPDSTKLCLTYTIPFLYPVAYRQPRLLSHTQSSSTHVESMQSKPSHNRLQ